MKDALTASLGRSGNVVGPFRWMFQGPYRNRIHVLLSILLSASFLWATVRAANAEQVLIELRSADHGPLLLALLVGVVGNLLRAVRWGVLTGYAWPKHLDSFFASMMIGYLANNVLPARMGEIVRVYMLERSAGVHKSTSVASIAVERLIDVLILVWILVPLGLFLPLPTFFRTGGFAVGFVSVVAAFLLFLLAHQPDRAKRIAVLAPIRISPQFIRRFEDAMSHFQKGLTVLRYRRQMLYAIGLSAAIWAIETASVGLIVGSLGLNLTWIAYLFVVAVLSLSFVLPSAPGAVGTYEFFAVSSLVPFQVDYSKALSVALVMHAITLFGSTGQGLACLWFANVHPRQVVLARAETSMKQGETNGPT